jgi:hypothetical protein
LSLAQVAFKREESPSIYPRKGAKKLTLWYGPYKIRPGNFDGDLSHESPLSSFSMDPSGTGWNALAADFPRDITILKSKADVVLEDFKTRADLDTGLYLHHLLFFDVTKKEPDVLGCGEFITYRQWPLSLFMVGSSDVGSGMFTPGDGSLNSGYYIGPNEPVAMMGDLVNLSNDTIHVYARAEIDYVPGKPEGLLDTTIQMVNVGQCDGKSGFFGLPHDGVQTQFRINGSAMEVAHDGYLVTSKGHLHDGGADISVKVNGNETCISRAEYGGLGSTRKGKDGSVWETIREMTYCPGPLRVKKGDKIELEARYDLEAHPARKQATGMMAEEMALVTFFFAADNVPAESPPI